MEHTSRGKKKPQCALCKRKLVTVFSVCRCKRMYCYSCVSPELHECPNLQEFIDAKENVSGNVSGK